MKVVGVSLTLFFLCALFALGAVQGYSFAVRQPLQLQVRSKVLHSSSTNTPTNALNLKQRLSAAGRGGLLAYGFLNFLYYTSVTAVAWRFSSAGRAETAAAALAATTLQQKVSVSAMRLGKVMGVVWVGSQITKPQRLAGALVLSPLADKFLTSVQSRTRLSQGAAFGFLCVLLLSSTALFYGALVVLSSLL
jgi:hypothetical protein